MSKELCKNCKYVELVKGVDGRPEKEGKCRLNPPQLVSIVGRGSSELVTDFPKVSIDSWCGEWEKANG